MQKYLHVANHTPGTVNFLHALVGLHDSAVFSMFAGESLSKVQAKFEQTLPVLARLKADQVSTWVYLSVNAVQALREVELSEDFMGLQPQAHEAAIRGRSVRFLSSYYFWRLIREVFLDHTEEAMEAARGCEKYKTPGSYVAALSVFYCAVLFLDVFDKLGPSEHVLLQQHVEKMRIWGKTSPATFGHKYIFLKVMMSKGGGNELAMLDAFDESISLAVEAGLVQDAALYAERCARWLAKSSPKRSCHYLAIAKGMYEAWGATCKVTEISSLLPIGATPFRGYRIPFDVMLTQLTIRLLRKKSGILFHREFHLRRPRRIILR
jgi:hypothetical protein